MAECWSHLCRLRQSCKVKPGLGIESKGKHYVRTLEVVEARYRTAGPRGEVQEGSDGWIDVQRGIKHTPSTVAAADLGTLESFCSSIPWSDDRLVVAFAIAVFGVLLMGSGKGIASFFGLLYSISSLACFF